MKRLWLSLLLLMIHCNDDDILTETSYGQYKWRQAAPFGSGSFPEEWRPGTFPLGLMPVLDRNNHLWMTGRQASWQSTDGYVWQRHHKADWGERISTGNVYFNDTLWMFGGMLYQERRFMNDIWFATDGINWRQHPAHAAWPPRKGQTMIVFKNRLWLFGGSNGVDASLSPNRFLNDIWSSADGKQWIQESAAAPWPAREYPAIVVFRDTLFMLGGQGHSDIWKSANGKDWTLVSNQSPWQQRYDHGALVYDNQIWVFGGRDSISTNAHNDVWHSADGGHWHNQTMSAPWTKRSAALSIVFNNKLWIFSGKHTAAKDNWGGDIWTMEIAQ